MKDEIKTAYYEDKYSINYMSVIKNEVLVSSGVWEKIQNIDHNTYNVKCIQIRILIVTDLG